MDKSNLLSISKNTGYSVSTVSRVLSGKGEQYRICKKTIELITEEAKKSNYTPNLIAKGLRTQKTNTIGLTIPGIDNPFFALLSSIIINQFKPLGYNVLILDIRESETEEIDALNSLVSRKVDGIIAVPVSSSPTFLEKISKSIPIVLIDRYFPKTILPYVCTDNFIGGYMAARHLINKGYKNILAIQGVCSSMPSKERLRGFIKAIEDTCSREIRYFVSGNAFSTETGYTQTKKAIESGKLPDAIFAFSTTIMLGALSAIKECKLKIPEDIGIISYDNNNFLDYLDPAITRIEQPVQQIGIKAAEILINLMEYKDDTTKKQILIKPSIIERNSC